MQCENAIQVIGILIRSPRALENQKRHQEGHIMSSKSLLYVFVDTVLKRSERLTSVKRFYHPKYPNKTNKRWKKFQGILSRCPKQVPKHLILKAMIHTFDAFEIFLWQCKNLITESILGHYVPIKTVNNSKRKEDDIMSS